MENIITQDFKRYVMRRLMRTNWYFKMSLAERKDLFMATQLACLRALAEGSEIDLGEAPEVRTRT
jgi:hypothetical protein